MRKYKNISYMFRYCFLYVQKIINMFKTCHTAYSKRKNHCYSKYHLLYFLSTFVCSIVKKHSPRNIS